MRSVPEVSSSRWGSADTGSNCPRRWGGSWPSSSPRGGARRGSPNWGQVGFERAGKSNLPPPFRRGVDHVSPDGSSAVSFGGSGLTSRRYGTRTSLAAVHLFYFSSFNTTTPP